MSKSLKRVRQALMDAGVKPHIFEMQAGTRTAAEAAAAAGCKLDQIAKSIIFRGEATGHVVLFITAGGNRIDVGKASEYANQPLGRADAEFVRAETGFAIGGVAPIGHLTPPQTFFDPRMLEFDLVWAAAGTPRHIFSIDPQVLQRIAAAQTAVFTL